MREADPRDVSVVSEADLRDRLREGGSHLRAAYPHSVWRSALRLAAELRQTISRQLPGLTFAKRPVLAVDEHHVDHDIVRAHAELAIKFVGDLPVEG